MTAIPTFPARPVNGGTLELAGPKIGRWFAEPKYNGWRALVHVPTGTMFNRHGKRLTIEKEFAKALEILREAYADIEWLDCEALERRHGIGRGTLIVFDYLDHTACYQERRTRLNLEVPTLDIDAKPEHQSAYLTPTWLSGEARQRRKGFDNAVSLWADLQATNRKWNTTGLNEFYEGIVMKRADSIYPMQLRSSDQATPYWMKHRWPIA